MIKFSDKAAEFVDSTFKVTTECIQVMSDIWEYHQVAHSINEVGRVDKTTIWNPSTCEVKIDLTPEALQRHWQFVFDETTQRLARQHDEQARDPVFKDRVVKVTRGKRQKGAQGKVIAIIRSVYRAGYKSSQEFKLGIALSDHKIPVTKNGRVFENYRDVAWVWARNCEVVDPVLARASDFAETATNTADKAVTAIREQLKHGIKEAA